MKATAQASRRGGPHNLGMCLANNTSGLNSLTFSNRHYESGATVLTVRVAAGKKRSSYSITRHGAQEALRLALKLRRDAGFPTCSLAQAQQALERFMAAGKKGRQ